MNELTAEKIRLVLLTVKAMRLAGKIPPEAPVSTRHLEAISHDLGCPVSAITFRRAEFRARESFRFAALALQASMEASQGSVETLQREAVNLPCSRSETAWKEG